VKRIVAIIAVMAVVLVVASTAMAGGSVVTGHNATPPTARSLGTHKSSSAPVAAGTLPFTGLDLAAIAGGAALLLAAGFVLRRAPRRQR
jgi:hypothetical protein